MTTVIIIVVVAVVLIGLALWAAVRHSKHSRLSQRMDDGSPPQLTRADLKERGFDPDQLPPYGMRKHESGSASAVVRPPADNTRRLSDTEYRRELSGQSDHTRALRDEDIKVAAISQQPDFLLGTTPWTTTDTGGEHHAHHQGSDGSADGGADGGASSGSDGTASSSSDLGSDASPSTYDTSPTPASDGTASYGSDSSASSYGSDGGGSYSGGSDSSASSGSDGGGGGGGD